jgi:hypothetical protein
MKLDDLRGPRQAVKAIDILGQNGQLLVRAKLLLGARKREVTRVGGAGR